MPADSVSPLSKGRGPAIRMNKTDHQKTNSWGRTKANQRYRKKQRELIEQGRFREAQQMDIDDVRSRFGTKYDDAIEEMLEYTDSIPEVDLKPKS